MIVWRSTFSAWAGDLISCSVGPLVARSEQEGSWSEKTRTQMVAGQRQIHKWINTETRRAQRKIERKRGREIGGGRPKWSFALEVVAVEMREVPIRALSANRLYGLPFFLRYQKTWTQYSQEMGFPLSQCEASALCSIWDGNHRDGRVTLGSLSLSLSLVPAVCFFFFSLFLGHKSICFSFMFTKIVSQNQQNVSGPGLLLLLLELEWKAGLVFPLSTRKLKRV